MISIHLKISITIKNSIINNDKFMRIRNIEHYLKPKNFSVSSVIPNDEIYHIKVVAEGIVNPYNTESNLDSIVEKIKQDLTNIGNYVQDIYIVASELVEFKQY